MPDDQENAKPLFLQRLQQRLHANSAGSRRARTRRSSGLSWRRGPEGPRTASATEDGLLQLAAPRNWCPPPSVSCSTVYVTGDCPKCMENAEVAEEATPEEEGQAGWAEPADGCVTRSPGVPSTLNGRLPLRGLSAPKPMPAEFFLCTKDSPFEFLAAYLRLRYHDLMLGEE